MNLLELYCYVDDFYQQALPALQSQQVSVPSYPDLRPSEIMTLLIHFHQSQYRPFKTYYIQYVQVYLCAAFPRLVTYARFVQLMPRFDRFLRLFSRN